MLPDPNFSMSGVNQEPSGVKNLLNRESWEANSSLYKFVKKPKKTALSSINTGGDTTLPYCSQEQLPKLP